MLLRLLVAPTGIFGVPLSTSIKYANVAISLTDSEGKQFTYGYVPIVVAKCGVFLKERGAPIIKRRVISTADHALLLATDVEGIFRLSGSAKRIKDLQAVFDTPDRYGKGLDWTGYTVHDAANILRRYLNQLPQPIVPLEYYERFRDPLRRHQAQAVGDEEAKHEDTGDFDHAAAISTYQRLITEIPPLNRQLLLYILDLLAVFSSKAEHNRMTSANLAAIFQPGMLSHPTHDMSPSEYRLSQDVIIFLIENQDNFLIGMSGTAADEKTVREVQGGVQPRQPASPMPRSPAIGRSASNASAGADSLRKFGGIRRNVSVSSKGSRASQNMPSPISPQPGSPHASLGSGGVHRSNTVPSKKSPGIPPASRFRNPIETSTAANKPPVSPGILTGARTASPSSRLAPGSSEKRSPSTHSSTTPTAQSPALNAVKETPGQEQCNERLVQGEKLTLQAPSPLLTGQQSLGTPKAERKVSSLFSKSPTSDAERKEFRQPNKLRKKRPESSNPSAHSSTHSLNANPESPANQAFYTPLPTPGLGSNSSIDPMSMVPPTFANTAPTPASETPPPAKENTQETSLPNREQNQHSNAKPLRPKSPSGSGHSRSSVTDFSEADQLDDGKTRREKKKRSWRASFSSKKTSEKPATSSSQLGVNTIAEGSSTSVNSSGRPRKSMTNDTQTTSTTFSTATEGVGASRIQSSSNESTPSKEHAEKSKEREAAPDPVEKRGPIGWFRAKVAHAKEERKEREAERERAKSPPRNGGGATGSKQSLNAIAQDQIPVPGRGRSIEAPRNEVPSSAAEPSVSAGAEKS